MPSPSTKRRDGFSGLDPCVHCGFCLPACPTYAVTGDESDSPRGRILLMRALEHGELASDDPGLVEHLDACLGCRGCEPVCPSGVEYGRGLEAARALLAEERGLGAKARGILTVFAREWMWRPLFTAARWLRDTGAARAFPAAPFRMLAATRSHALRAPSFAAEPPSRRAAESPSRRAAEPPSRPTVALFTGCVMDTLFRHVHEATRRVLEANGYRVVEPDGQTCCGALHDHAGDRGTARRLAARNVRALADAADFIVVNSAGCGALLKDYGHLLGGDRATGPQGDRGTRPQGHTATAPQGGSMRHPEERSDEGSGGGAPARLAAKVRDVTELLAAAGPRAGAPLELDVAYDAPCHLQHAQRVHAEPLAVLSAIPGLRLQVLPGSGMCCGSAGIYSMLEPAMSQRVLDAKITELAAASPRPRLVATGNPGCLMQIGAGLRAAGLEMEAVHPVELLDESYRRAGYYS